MGNFNDGYEKLSVLCDIRMAYVKCYVVSIEIQNDRYVENNLI